MKNYIYYHQDPDGYCAGSLVKNSVGDPYADNEFFGFNYGQVIKMPETIEPTATVYIVDCSLTPGLADVIRKYIAAGCKVIHIDHHMDSINAVNNPEFSDILASIKYLYKEGVSGSLLTWIYFCMDSAEQDNPSQTEWGLDDARTLAFIGPENNAREYGVPMAVRLVDDHDIRGLRYADTPAFNAAIMSHLEEELHPSSELWTKLVFDHSQQFTIAMVENGRYCLDTMYRQYERDRKRARHVSLPQYGIEDAIILNTSTMTTDVLGDLLQQAPLCILYQQNADGTWQYSLRSKADGMDCNATAKRINERGGGHVHAAGVRIPEYIF